VFGLLTKTYKNPKTFKKTLKKGFSSLPSNPSPTGSWKLPKFEEKKLAAGRGTGSSWPNIVLNV